MARIERSIEVDVPARTAYNQWTMGRDETCSSGSCEDAGDADDGLHT